MSGYACAWDDPSHPARFIFTDLATGNTLAYCEDHFPPGMLPIIAAELGLDPLKFYEHVEKYLARQAAAERRAAKQVPGANADVTPAGYETFHDVGRDLRAERKAGVGPDGEYLDDDDDDQRTANIVPDTSDMIAAGDTPRDLP